MVTTNSLNADLNFTLQEMYDSELPEDRAMAEEAFRVILALVKFVKPIAKYISLWVGTKKVIKIHTRENGYVLALDEDGNFGWIECDGKEFELTPAAVRFVEVSAIVEGLEKALKDAQEKREKHLDSLKKRTQLFTDLMQRIEQADNTAATAGGK